MSQLAEAAAAPAGPQRGVRVRDVTEYRRVATISAASYLVASVAGVLLWIGWRHDIAHPALHVAMEAYGFGVGAVLVTLAYVAPDGFLERYYPAAVWPLLLASAAAVPLTCYAMGFSRFGADVLLYDVVVVLGFYILRTREAVGLLVLVVSEHAVLIAVSPGVSGAFPQWFYLVLTLTVTGLLIGKAMSEIDGSRRSVADLNRDLQQRVADEVAEVERLTRLRRFLSTPVAEAVLDSADGNPLVAHRREIAVMFCDLRGLTAYARQAEPEDVIEILDSYFARVGEQLTRFKATVGSINGDGVMAFLNDPYPCDRPAHTMAELCLAIRDSVSELNTTWRRLGYDFGAGIGVAVGHATLGLIGFENRTDYTALGTVVNLASRLCSEARPGEILVDARTHADIAGDFATVPSQERTLKGFAEPVPTFTLAGHRLPVAEAAVPPALG